MRLALIREMPPGRIASSTSSSGARRTASHDGKRSRSRMYATSRLRSFVFCDRTVRISSSTGRRCGRSRGRPYAWRKRSRIAWSLRRMADRIVYLHGVPQYGEMWEPFLERTGGDAPDLPGFGQADKPAAGDYSYRGLGGWFSDYTAGLERF